MTNHHLTTRPGSNLPTDPSRTGGLDRSGESGWAHEPEEASFDWRRMVSSMIRHKWIVVFGAVLGVGAAYVAWQQVETGLWSAQGSLWVQQASSNEGPIVTDEVLQSTALIALIGSRSVMDTVVMRQKLYVTASPGEMPLFESFRLAGEAPPAAPETALGPVGADGTVADAGALVAGGTPAAGGASAGAGDSGSAAPIGQMPSEEPVVTRDAQTDPLAETGEDPALDLVPLQPGSYALRVDESGRTATLTSNGIEAERGAPGDTFGRPLGFTWTPPRDSLAAGRTISFTLVHPRDAATALSTQLRATPVAGGFIEVGMTGPDPVRLTSIVNAVMERHVELAAELKSGHLREQTQLLAHQLGVAAAQRDQASKLLTEFRVATATEPSENVAMQPGLAATGGPVFDQFFQMRIQQEQLRRDRQRIEEVLASATPEVPFRIEAIELIPSVTTSSQLTQSITELVTARLARQDLLERYTSEHADVIELTGKIRTLEQNSIPMLLRQLAGQLEADEMGLAARIETSGVELSAIPTRTIQEEGLRLELDIAANLYADLSSRYETAKLAQQSSPPDLRILDPAVVSPIPRAADRRAGIAAALFFALLGVGMTGAVMADKLDPRMRTPDEVSTVLGLNVLGVIPRIRVESGEGGSMDEAREAFRGLRTNLEYAHGSAGPMVVTISSPSMSEGKTLVTSNLGMCLAELGRRTLVIDGDTRRGDLHRVFDGERKPGLTDFLRGKEPLEKIVQSTAHPNLNFIGSGTQVANSPELLSASRMGDLMAEMRKRYDVILVDSPPLGVGADALVLGCLSAHMLLLFRSGSTHKDLAQARLEPLNRLPLRLLGAVLNDYAPDRLSSSYHNSYYGNYLPGYEAGAEEEESALEGRPA